MKCWRRLRARWTKKGSGKVAAVPLWDYEKQAGKQIDFGDEDHRKVAAYIADHTS